MKLKPGWRPENNMMLGVHCSVAGGVRNAFEEAMRLEIDTFQIFTKNQRQWKEKQFEEAESIEFKGLYAPSGVQKAFSHATYLINLCASDSKIHENSILTLAGEIIRCDALNLSYTVLHPGACGIYAEKDAVKKVADSLKVVIDHTSGLNAGVLLENTAGQGTSLGWKFEHIREIIELTGSERIGMCLDTCHAFAAGYDIRTQTGFEDMIEEIDRLIGLDKLKVIHINDSKGQLGSRIDRHAHIGQGCLGLEPFRQVLKTFPHLPKVLETPKENDMDRVNLKVLRDLIQ